jgi:GxxExxY protein
MDKLKHNEITDKIIKAFYQVYNTLGYGFLEKVYENGLIIELKKLGLNVIAQHPIKVFYDNAIVGGYFADIFVESTFIIL